MEEIIKLKSRDSTNTYLKLLPKKEEGESKTYLLKTSGRTLRIGSFPDGRQFIDPSGGPMIVEGQMLTEANALIKSIDFIEGFGYIITFV